MRGLTVSAFGVAVAALVAGCGAGSKPQAMVIDGPNQVIFSVPSMT